EDNGMNLIGDADRLMNLIGMNLIGDVFRSMNLIGMNLIGETDRSMNLIGMNLIGDADRSMNLIGMNLIGMNLIGTPARSIARNGESGVSPIAAHDELIGGAASNAHHWLNRSASPWAPVSCA